jgi:tyrosyl-tRNA synthetase
MSQGPRAAKAAVAFDIVKRFHGEVSARAAEQNFEKTFAKGGVPDDIAEVAFDGSSPIADVLVKAGIVESKSDWRRLIDSSAVKTDKDEKISDPNFKPAKGSILKVGKRRFVKFV